VSTINANPVGSATSAALAAAQTNTSSLIGDTQERFLTLLVTQLQNQDPMNPMDNSEVTTQIAQLSTVNGINQLNNTLLALAGQLDVSQSMQAATLIGKQVLVPGSKVLVGGGDGDKVVTPFGADLISPASKVNVTIVDGAGQVVRQVELGPQAPGVLSLDWDGKNDGGVAVPDGAYTARFSAVGTDGSPVGINGLTSGQVGSVVNTAQGPMLDLGLAGRFSLLDVKKIM
jgi:flagellar basal-body rod modification protein FlgD